MSSERLQVTKAPQSQSTPPEISEKSSQTSKGSVADFIRAIMITKRTSGWKVVIQKWSNKFILTLGHNPDSVG